MIERHPASERGRFQLTWLESAHSFSFGDYLNPKRMGFGALRVLNDDRVAPKEGFGRHSHRDMEIITIPLKGSIRHEDSEGNSEIIREDDVQIMSAGTGIFHSEWNESPDESVEFLQIWVIPQQIGVVPRYAQAQFPAEERRDQLQCLVAPEAQGALPIFQDACLSRIDLSAQKSFSYSLMAPSRGVFLFLISGRLKISDHTLNRRDAVAISEESTFEFFAEQDSEILLIEVPLELPQ